MPADPIHPDQLDGEQRFRADLVAYLDSLPVGELAELLGELPSRRQQPKKALAEIYNAENKAAAVKAAHTFATEYGAKWPKAVAKIVDDLDVLTAFYDYPAEHWIHLRTTNPSRPSPPSGSAPGSPRAPAPAPPAWRWPSSSSSPPRPTGARSMRPTWSSWSAPARGSRAASSSNDPTNQEVISKRRDQGGQETGRHVAQRELPGQVRLLDGWVHGRTQTCRVGR
jgi:hypothetical protein